MGNIGQTSSGDLYLLGLQMARELHACISSSNYEYDFVQYTHHTKYIKHIQYANTTTII